MHGKLTESRAELAAKKAARNMGRGGGGGATVWPSISDLQLAYSTVPVLPEPIIQSPEENPILRNPPTPLRTRVTKRTRRRVALSAEDEEDPIRSYW